MIICRDQTLRRCKNIFQLFSSQMIIKGWRWRAHNSTYKRTHEINKFTKSVVHEYCSIYIYGGKILLDKHSAIPYTMAVPYTHNNIRHNGLKPFWSQIHCGIVEQPPPSLLLRSICFLLNV